MVTITRTAARSRRLRVDERDVRALSDALSRGPSGAWVALAAAVGRAVLPAGVIPPGIDRIVVVADGALAIVPFEVLPFDGELLVQRAAVSYMPTAALFTRARAATRGPRMPWHLQLRAFADPIPAQAGDGAGRLPYRAQRKHGTSPVS